MGAIDQNFDAEEFIKLDTHVRFEVGDHLDIDQLFDDIAPLLQQHWCEVAIYKEQRPIEIDRDFYRVVYAAKRYVGVLAKYNDRIVGYASFFLKNHPHYKNWKVATNDVYFVAPEHRSIFVASGLFRKSEEYLKSLGVNSISNGTKRNKDLGKLLKYFGYEATETIHEKVL